MISFNRRTKVYVCKEPMDMRASDDTLFANAKGVLNQDPFSGHLFRYASWNQMTNATETELFPSVAFGPSGYARYFFVKRIRAYYEEKHFHIQNEFEPQVQQFRDFLKW